MHENTHSDVRPFACYVCDKSFCELNKLRLHMSTHVDSSVRDADERPAGELCVIVKKT